MKNRFALVISKIAKPIVAVRKYPWSAIYKTNEYLGLLNTYSDHISLSEQKRGALFEDISEVIEKNGGFIERPYLSVLYIAERNFSL